MRIGPSLIVIAVIASICLIPTHAWAEKAPLPPEALRKTATHVVKAEVVAIYTRTANEGGYRVTRHVAEIRVREVEKGDGIDPSAPLYVRYWTQRWSGIGQAPLGTAGHRGLPNAGDTLRIYLARNAYDGFTDKNSDGGFNVIGANGFEKLPELSSTVPAPAVPDGEPAPQPRP